MAPTGIYANLTSTGWILIMQTQTLGQSGQREVGEREGGGQQVALFCVGNAQRIRVSEREARFDVRI